MDRKTKEIVALKKIFDAFQNQVDAQRTYREIMFLKAFGAHPNIIKLQGIHKASNNKDIYLVFDYMGMDFYNITNIIFSFNVFVKGGRGESDTSSAFK